MSDMFKMLKTIVETCEEPLERRMVARDFANGFILSTVLSRDCGYETAIIDAQKTYPVERYSTKELALRGHLNWLQKLPVLKTVTTLGYGDLVDDKVVVLKPYSEEEIEAYKIQSPASQPIE